MTTFIDTKACQKIRLDTNQGTVAEIANRQLCGAENFVGALRWLENGERFEADLLPDMFQLLYLEDGDGIITLNGVDHPVAKGAGVYLEPGETASICHTGPTTTKLLHLIVSKSQSG